MDVWYVTNFTKQYYVWDKIYVYDDTTLSDNEREFDNITIPYVQTIETILWEMEIMNIKKYLYNKFLIGQETDPDTKIEFVSWFWWQTYTVSTTLSQLSYLQEVNMASDFWELWTNIMWFWLVWWNLWWDKYIWPAWMSTVEVPLWQTANMMKVIYEWKIDFGWMLVWYDVLEQHLTELDWVIS